MPFDSAGGDPGDRPGPDDNDTCLAWRLRQHSQDALAEAFRRHGAAVVGQARRNGDPAAAEDIAQEVFLALWREPDRFEPSRGSLRSYLLAMTRHRTIDVYRSEQSRRRRQAGSYPTADSLPDPEDAVVTADQRSRVRCSLDDLPADERVAIDLAYFGQHTYREVARLLNQPEGTVKSRIRHGLQRLRSARDLAPVGAAAPSRAC